MSSSASQGIWRLRSDVIYYRVHMARVFLHLLFVFALCVSAHDLAARGC